MNKVFLFFLALALFFIPQLLNKQTDTQLQALPFTAEELIQFEQWKMQHNIVYQSDDLELYRLQIFVENLRFINHQNSLGKSYTLGLNKFADLSKEEFAKMYLGTQQKPTENVQSISYKSVSASTNINWVSKGAVTPVKNQGQCGSCWAFSTTGNLEGVYEINNGDQLSFSEQQLVDCSTSFGNEGCNGGEMDYAFEYSIQYGNEQESQYPYRGVDGSCKYNAASATKVITGYTDVPAGNCQALGTALQNQPISIAVDAQTWSFYNGGVFDLCGTSLDHGVLLVGLVDNSGSGYWLVKNSWGASWGEQGYIRLSLGNTCGMCNQASYGNLA